MKPACVKCQRFFRPKKNDFFFVEGMPAPTEGGHYPTPGTAEPDKWNPYKLWAADLWECEGCGAQILSGYGKQTIREHYHPDFEAVRKQLGADLQINDC